MASRVKQRLWMRLMPAALGGAVAVAAAQAWANDAAGTLQPPCPRLASPAGQSYLQPERLQPSQVSAKTKLGCLSPADAYYGADGCPLRYCGNGAGTFALPPQR